MHPSVHGQVYSRCSKGCSWQPNAVGSSRHWGGWAYRRVRHGEGIRITQVAGRACTIQGHHGAVACKVEGACDKVVS